MHIRGEQPTDCTVIHLALICCWGKRRWAEGGGRCSLTEVGGTSISPAFASIYLEFIFPYLTCAFYLFIYFCILHKTRFDHFLIGLVVVDVLGQPVGSGGWGGACDSDIRQHVKLCGHPQRWNWRRLIDRQLGNESQSR